MIVTVKEEDQLPKKINYQRRRCWSRRGDGVLFGHSCLGEVRGD
jgi:hypothetical protein